nr:enoyl-ACP reductase FabI [Haloglycomyces albus]
MGILDGKTLLITGVITEQSLGFGVAKYAQEQGAKVILTGYGRLTLVKRIAQKLPEPAPVIELDVTDPEHLDNLSTELREHTDRIDGVLHAIAYAPETALGGNFLNTTWEDVAKAMEVSTFSYKSLATAVLPLMTEGGSVVGLDFDATKAWSVYDWMGVAKAGLESVNRYLARDLGPKGIRVNLVSAGPMKTMAAKSIPGFEQFEEEWKNRSPLEWDLTDSEPVAKACAVLLSDLLPATTGEMIHVDGGFHAIGA